MIEFIEIVLDSEGNSSIPFWWEVSFFCCGGKRGSKLKIYLIEGSTPFYLTKEFLVVYGSLTRKLPHITITA